jgi:hypothetical protein
MWLPYNNNQNETGLWLKMFFGLPFLPVHEVTEAFVDLISICPPQDACTAFGDYTFLTTTSKDSFQLKCGHIQSMKI